MLDIFSRSYKNTTNVCYTPIIRKMSHLPCHTTPALTVIHTWFLANEVFSKILLTQAVCRHIIGVALE